MHAAHEVGVLDFVTDHQPAVVLQPRERPLHLSPLFIAPQR
jgi:hypothetical protein